jgi:hypothetical protein
MPAKRVPITIDQSHLHSKNYRRELEALYARRSAIDALIHSLQNYDRFRDFPRDGKTRKTA